MKKKKSGKKKYAHGTAPNSIVRHYIESPQEAIVENDIAIAKAKYEAETNPWSTGLNVLGNMALQYGMQKGGAFGKAFGNVAQFGNQIASMGYGGTAEGEIEAEGEEIVQTPDGNVTELKGPKHEQGGIDLDVPAGTEIFSDRIFVKGKSMADRKKARENRLKAIEKKMQGATDKVGKDTYERTKESLAMEEQSDLEIQSMINFVAGTNGKAMYGLSGNPGLPELLTLAMYMDTVAQTDKTGKSKPSNEATKHTKKLQKMITSPKGAIKDKTMRRKAKPQLAAYGTGSKDSYANGTGPFPDLFSFFETLQQGLPDITGTTDDIHNPTYSNPIDLSVLNDAGKTPGFNPEGDSNIFEDGTFVQPDEGASRSAEGGSFLDNLFGGEGDGTSTFGNTVGLVGNLISAFGPMRNTLKNRAGDTPNINAFEDFGNDGLDVIDESKGYIAGQRDNALKDVNRATVSNKNRSRNTARGVNTMRALDLASDMAENQSRENIYDNFSKQMMQILSQEAQMENQQDQVVMSGEQNRDLADRQDRDNFYTQMAQDIATMGQGIQQTGKDLNQVEQQKTIMKMLNQLSKYGITFDSDFNLQNPEN